MKGANTMKKIGLDFFKEYKNIGDMQFNGANLFTFVQYDVDVDEDTYNSNLFLYDMDKREIVKQLTFENNVGMHQWIDEENIVISSIIDVDDKEKYNKGIPLVVMYKLNIKSGQYTKLCSINRIAYKFEYISDNQFMFLCDDSLMDDAYRKESSGDWDKYLEIVKRESKYFIADEVPFWTNDGGYANTKRCRVYYYEDGILHCLTPDGTSSFSMTSYKNKYAAFYSVASGHVQKSKGKLYKFDYQSKELSIVDDSEIYIYTKVQAVDETHLLVFRSDCRIHGEYQNEYIDIIDLASGQYSRNNSKADVHLYDNLLNDITYLTGWSNKITVMGDEIIFVSTKDGACNLFKSKIGSDDIFPVTNKAGKVLDYFVKDNTIWMIAIRGMSGSEIYLLNIDTMEEMLLSDFNLHLDSEYQYSWPYSCDFINSEGVEINGWVMKPNDFVGNQKYPVILFIHGGPQAAYGPLMIHEMAVMCSEGYGVIYCNPTGSEGKGGDFSDINGRWGTIDYSDIMEFVDTAIEQNPWIDDSRLAVTGGSYGGIMTNWIISHTDRFKAAVSDRSVSNLFSDYCLSDIGFACNTDIYHTTPWENPEYVWEQSALKYAPDIHTPVLFIHGVDDYRCPYDNALQLHSAIQYFGGNSRVFAVKGETHEMCRSGLPSNRIRRLSEMISWFKKYL